MKKRLLIAVVFLVSFVASRADSVDSLFAPTFWEKLVERIDYSDKTINRNIVRARYGVFALSYPTADVLSKFSTVYLTQFDYGFFRWERDYKESGFAKFASESVFLGNLSSHMGLPIDNYDLKTTDNWRFGFEFTNGYGYDSLNGDGETLFLFHGGSVSWAKIDIENPGDSPAEQEKFDYFDENYKFGTIFETGAKYLVDNGVGFELSYEHNFVFPNFEGFKWFGTSIAELALQRTIDYLGEDFLDDYPRYFPLLNFIVKNCVSAIFYEFRRNKMHWFFPSKTPISYDGLILSFSYVF